MRCVCGTVLVAVCALAAPAAAQEYKCATAAEIRAALAKAGPGDLIAVKPGDYDMGGEFATGRDGAPDKAVTLTCEGARGYARLRVSGQIGFRVRHRHWTLCGIHLEGDPQKTEVPLYVDGQGGAGDLLVTDCRVSGSSECLVQASRSREKAAGNITVEFSEFFDCQGSALNLFAGDNWVIRRNYIHDYGKGGAVSYGVALKGGGKNGVIEANLVDANGQATTLGISFGGGLSPDGNRPLDADGKPGPEQDAGICRNNIVIGTSDMPYHTNKAAGCRFLNNLAWGASGFQRQNAAGADPVLLNNLIGGSPKGIAAESKNNLSPVKREWFLKPEALDFRLSEDGKKELGGKGEVVLGNPEDFFGAKRDPAKPGLGPVLPDAKESTKWVDRRK